MKILVLLLALGLPVLGMSFDKSYEPYEGTSSITKGGLKRDADCIHSLVEQLLADRQYTEITKLGLKLNEVQLHRTQRGSIYHKFFLTDSNGRDFTGNADVDFTKGKHFTCKAGYIEIHRAKSWAFQNEWTVYDSKCARKMHNGERINEKCQNY